MQSLCKRDSGISSTHSGSPFIVGCSSWKDSTESNVYQSSISKSLSLTMGVPAQHGHYTKQLGFQFQDQDSSSTQSTGQSHSEVASMKESNLSGQGMVSSNSGHNKALVRSVGGDIKLVSSMGTQDFVFPSQLDYSQPIARVPFHYAESYFNGLLGGAYGPQAMKMNPFMSIRNSTVQFSGGDSIVPSLKLRTNSSKLESHIFTNLGIFMR